jgi:curli biogenesis system outer membrane secretion channel CsgG
MRVGARYIVWSCLAVTIAGCATVSRSETRSLPQGPDVSASLEQAGQRTLKRKVAIARFSNETKYGRGVFGGRSDSPIEKQAADILKSRLVETGKVVLFDVDEYQPGSGPVGADYLIAGSVSEFGRKTESDVGVFSRTRKQTAHAAVNLRLMRTSTGQVIYSEEGAGEASGETGRVFGVGTSAGYDSTLDDKAISAAISKLVSNLVENLLDDPWRTYVLRIDGGTVLIAGGARQGLRKGDVLAVLERGERVHNPQFDTWIELPGRPIARIEVQSTFGDDVMTEGSLCALVSGDLQDRDPATIIVQEVQE